MASKYAYGSLQWNADGHGDTGCDPTAADPVVGSGVATTSEAVDEDLDVVDGVDGITAWTDDYTLTSFEHVNVFHGDGAQWDVPGEAGDLRTYEGAVFEVRLAGATVLRIQDLVNRYIVLYPDATGPFAPIGPLGPGGPVGVSIGLGTGTIDPAASDPAWVAQFDPAQAGGVGPHVVEFTYATMSPAIQGCFGTFDLPDITLAPVHADPACGGDHDRDTDADGIIDALDQQP